MLFAGTIECSIGAEIRVRGNTAFLSGQIRQGDAKRFILTIVGADPTFAGMRLKQQKHELDDLVFAGRDTYEYFSSPAFTTLASPMLAASNVKYVDLDSPGGVLIEGVVIGWAVKQSRAVVRVRSNRICASSCAIAAMMNKAELARTARIGIHRPSGSWTTDQWRMIEQHLLEAGLPKEAIRRMEQTPFEQISEVTADDARVWNLRWVVKGN